MKKQDPFKILEQAAKEYLQTNEPMGLRGRILEKIPKRSSRKLGLILIPAGISAVVMVFIIINYFGFRNEPKAINLNKAFNSSFSEDMFLLGQNGNKAVRSSMDSCNFILTSQQTMEVK